MSIKCHLLHIIHSAISRFWVRPLEDRAIPALEKKNGGVPKFLLRWATWWANAGRVIVNEMHLWKIRWVGPEWSVTYLGNGESTELLCYHLFPTPPEEVETSRVFLWQVPALVKKHTEEGDLVVCELNQIVRLSPSGVDQSFTLPKEIMQVIDEFDRPLDEIMADFQPHIQKRIHQLEAQGYSFEPTHSLEDFDLFYHRMYVPYIEQRHTGRSAQFDSYDCVKSYFSKGVLILLKKCGDPIAGGVLQLTGDICRAFDMGVLDGRDDLLKQGSNIALWWFEMLWAYRQGARRYFLGSSFAFTANGPFNFKRQWGTHVYRKKETCVNWSFYGRDLSVRLRAHLSGLGFITEVDGKHYQILLHSPAEPVDETKLANQLFHLSSCGIAGMILISADGERHLILPEAIRQDPTGRRYLAVPNLVAL